MIVSHNIHKNEIVKPITSAAGAEIGEVVGKGLYDFIEKRLKSIDNKVQVEEENSWKKESKKASPDQDPEEQEKKVKKKSRLSKADGQKAGKKNTKKESSEKRAKKEELRRRYGGDAELNSHDNECDTQGFCYVKTSYTKIEDAVSSFEEVIDNQGFKAKTPEEKMSIARRFTHEVGELIMKGEDVIGEGAKWAWEELEDGAPGVALRLKHVASVIGGYIGDVIEYGADKVPDFVKDEYREFLLSTTAEERKFWEYAVSLGAAGGLKKLGSGLEKINKLEKIDGTDGGGVYKRADVGDGEVKSHQSAIELKKQMLVEEQIVAAKAAGIFDDNGMLRSHVMEMRLSGGIGNPEVIRALTKDGSKIEDWGKFRTTETLSGTRGNFDWHFYKNKVTGKINTEIDYKPKPVGPQK